MYKIRKLGICIITFLIPTICNELKRNLLKYIFQYFLRFSAFSRGGTIWKWMLIHLYIEVQLDFYTLFTWTIIFTSCNRDYLVKTGNDIRD